VRDVVFCYTMLHGLYDESVCLFSFFLSFFITGRGPAYFWTSALRPFNYPVR